MGISNWIKNEPQDIFSSGNAKGNNKVINPVPSTEGMRRPEDVLNENEGKNKMILFEPRAYSETQQIADELKISNTVVINLKRVTSNEAEKIINFISGTLYAIDGRIEKIGPGIFLCTPNNVNVEGSITEENSGKGIYDNDDITLGL